MNFSLLLLPLLLASVKAWGSDEMEIFDLVEEVNQINRDFYEYMEITKDASTSDVRKAYRKMSLILHPDRNSAEDASEKFRWLAAIYEILKDPEKRAIYDKVLVEGLPDWRMPIYYYRRMRKMGLVEGLVYLFGIATVCQYFVNMAAFWEKKFTLRENISSQANKKRFSKKSKKGENFDQIIEEELEILGPRPTVFDTLPFQLYRLSKSILFSLPTLPHSVYSLYMERKVQQEEEARALKEEEETQKKKEAEKLERKERQKQKKLEKKLYPERVKHQEGSESDEDLVAPQVDDVFNRPANALQMWTDDDLAKLTKLVKKFPGGTPDRWETIAAILERLPWEVTKMAQKIKNNSYMVPAYKCSQGVTGLETTKIVPDDRLEKHANEVDSFDSNDDDDDDDSSTDDSDYGGYSVATKEDYVPVEIKDKKKTKGGKSGEVVVQEQTPTAEAVPGQDGWNQQQQKALESALQQFPKGTSERWDRISAKVTGKSKEECMLRVRYLAEIVKKKKDCGE